MHTKHHAFNIILLWLRDIHKSQLTLYNWFGKSLLFRIFIPILVDWELVIIYDMFLILLKYDLIYKKLYKLCTFVWLKKIIDRSSFPIIFSPDTSVPYTARRFWFTVQIIFVGSGRSRWNGSKVRKILWVRRYVLHWLWQSSLDRWRDYRCKILF